MGNHDIGIARCGSDEELARLVGVNLACYLSACQVYVIAASVRRCRLYVVWRLGCAGKLVGIGCFGFGFGFGGLDALALLVQVAFDGGGRFDQKLVDSGGGELGPGGIVAGANGLFESG